MNTTIKLRLIYIGIILFLLAIFTWFVADPPWAESEKVGDRAFVEKVDDPRAGQLLEAYSWTPELSLEIRDRKQRGNFSGAAQNAEYPHARGEEYKKTNEEAKRKKIGIWKE